MDTGELVCDPVSGEPVTIQQWEDALRISGMEGLVIETSPSYNTALIRTEPRKRAAGGGRKPKVILNPYQKELQDMEKEDMPEWLEDVLTGVGRQSTGNTVLSGTRILSMLRAFGVLTTRIICDKENYRRWVCDESRPISERYAKELLACFENAVNALTYHLERGRSLGCS